MSFLRSVFLLNILLPLLLNASCGGGGSGGSSNSTSAISPLGGLIAGQSFAPTNAYVFIAANGFMTIAFPPNDSSFSCSRIIAAGPSLTVLVSNAVGTYSMTVSAGSNGYPNPTSAMAQFYTGAGIPTGNANSGTVQILSTSSTTVTGTLNFSEANSNPVYQMSGPFSATICSTTGAPFYF